MPRTQSYAIPAAQCLVRQPARTNVVLRLAARSWLVANMWPVAWWPLQIPGAATKPGAKLDNAHKLIYTTGRAVHRPSRGRPTVRKQLLGCGPPPGNIFAAIPKTGSPVPKQNLFVFVAAPNIWRLVLQLWVRGARKQGTPTQIRHILKTAEPVLYPKLAKWSYTLSLHTPQSGLHVT